MKSLILKASAIGAMLTLLVGCGGNAGTVSDPSQDITAPSSQEDKQKEVSDILLWMNGTYAVLTELNGGDYTLIGGLEPTETNQGIVIDSLESAWEVTDRASADETLEWLINEGGHRKGYAEMMETLDVNGTSNMTENELVDYINSMYQVEDEDEVLYLAKSYLYYLEYGAGAIDAWDYCRAMSLVGWYYVAGYYTEEEAINKSLEIANIIQERFTSWDEMMDSYFMGYEYWGNRSSDERREIYEEIKTRENCPYRLEWNLPLESNE